MSRKTIKKIFIEDLQMKIYHGNKCIDWTGSKGRIVRFIYGDIKGSFLIKDVVKGNNCSKLLLQYKDTEKWYDAGHVKNCEIGSLIGTYSSEYRYKIGQTIKENNRNFTIIGSKKEQDNTGIVRKYYKYHCNECTAELWMEESNIKRGSSCACCGNISNKIVVKGINDIATTNPWMIPYFENEEDCYKYTCDSNKKINMKCINCGHKKELAICYLHKNGFSCPICGDGISYPEKVIMNLLKQLNIDFIMQLNNKQFNWCDKFRYDFYFELNNKKYIIETHGLQHYENNGGFFNKLKEQQKIDIIKQELALKNGIDEYIIIDCRESNIDFIKENILHSKLNNIFNLNNVDWNYINEKSQKSLLVEICKYWKEHNNINSEKLSTTYVGKVFNVDRTTVLRYIKIGNDIGLCNYTKRNTILKNENNYLEVYKDNIKLGEFNTYKEIIEHFKNENFSYGKISNAYKNNKSYKGYMFIIKEKDIKEAI